ncbi:RabGAP/TBC [Schizopora paradoxa]|uniref:RabGAP/TBC n=1 Tax=Schizopora paradoxa TaxID=27342 RepID=A0A0H2RB78_9AGAM|nr:RabGAP/TBC [Schizopora paradoxa]
MSTDPGSDDSLARDERPSIQISARTESPFSSVSGGARSPIPPRFIDSPEPVPRPPQLADAADANSANAEAHRSREQRWITAMAAVPASQSRKSKKIRRLVLEGVPSSVRSLVWSHLVDSKAKITPGVYDKFGGRAKAAVVTLIEDDARRCFPDHQHLHDSKGPLVTLLTTYLTMFPDIEYQRSLVAIAGHLLLQAPEEDSFWMFVSIMDTHIRTYFSSKAVQMDVDASIFGKVIESTQPQLAKRLFAELGISPIEICRPWFSSVFTTTLPPECVNRVWDVFLCEGPPFLFRIGLALLNLCRPHIESCKDKTSALVILAQPDALSLLPSDPDDLITSALSVKLKDDDVRKQRVKLEAQMKRQTQSLASRSTSSLVSKISLPR